MGVDLVNNQMKVVGATALVPFPGTQYFQSIDASVGVSSILLTIGDTSVRPDRVRFKSNTNAPSTLVAGDMWMDFTSGSYEMYFYGSGPGALRIAHSGTAFGGDVTGTIASNTVGKLQGRTVYNAAPNNGDLLTWDNANTRWAPTAPVGGTPYYTVLDNTATTAQLNTALTNYDVVYLKSGAYSNVTGLITIPNKKQLIGLSGPGASTNKPEITLVTGTPYVAAGRACLIENIAFNFGTGSTTAMIEAATTSHNVTVRACDFFGYGAGTTQWATIGAFKEISGCYFYRCYGMNLNTNVSADGGAQIIKDNYWVGHSTDTSGSNTGLYLGVSGTYVDNCYFEGGEYGIRTANVQYLKVSNILCVNQTLGAAPRSVWFEGSSGTPYLCTFSNIYIRGNNTGNQIGFYATGDWNTYNGIYAYDTAGDGILISQSDHSTFGDLGAYDCGDALGQSGVYFYQVTNGAVGTICSNGSGVSGLYLHTCSKTTFGTITANNNAADGVILYSSNTDCSFGTVVANNNTTNGINVYAGNADCTFGVVTANDNGSDGVEVAASQTGIHFAGGTTTGNTAYGFYGAASGTPACRIDAWYSFGNTTGQFNIGTGWLDYSTPGGISDPGTKATNDLLQYTGSVWDAKGAASGDRLGGTLYGSAVDLAGHLTFTADNTYDIGADGATRPRYGYFGTEVKVGSSVRVRSDRIGLHVNSSEPSTLAEGDFYYQSGKPRFRDGTMGRVLDSGRKYLAVASGSNATESVAILQYIWPAGEFDVSKSMLKVCLFLRTSSSIQPRIRLQYTSNAGGAWTNIRAIDASTNLTIHAIDINMAHDNGYANNTLAVFWVVYNFTTGATEDGVPANWLNGSGSNYGFRVLLEYPGGTTMYYKGFLWEDRVWT
jgi:hypothetical protein